MHVYNPRRYQSPKTVVCKTVVGEMCIGFGEGSIPPEDSDSNQGWLDEEALDEYRLPNGIPHLWDE